MLSHLLWPKSIRAIRATRRESALRIFFSLSGIGLAAAIYGVAVWFLGLCANVEIIGPLLVRRLLDVILAALMGVLFLSNVITALSSFFLAKDLDLLVATPVPLRALYVSRMAEQILHSSWMVIAFGLPVLLAFARVAGSAMSYLMLPIILVPLLIIPAAFAFIVVLLLVRYLPAVRLRNIVAAISLLTFIVLYLVIRVIEPERFLNPDGFSSIVHFMASFSTPTHYLMPSHWATVVFADTFRGAIPQDSTRWHFAALVTGAMACHTVALWLFQWLYLPAYSRSQQSQTVGRISRWVAALRNAPIADDGVIRAPGRHGADADLLRWVGALTPPGVEREFVIKDSKLLLRDATQWSQLILLIALVFVYLYNFRHFRSIGETGLIGPTALFVMGLGLSGFVATAISVRFAYPLISGEGRMMWLLHTAPVSPQQILRAKLWTTLPPLLMFSQIISVASSLLLGVTPALVGIGAAVMFFTSVSVAAISVGLGALLPDYEAESAAKVASSFGGLVTMIVALTATFLYVGLAAYPAYLCTARLAPRWLVLGSCITGTLATFVASTIIPLRLGRRALSKH